MVRSGIYLTLPYLPIDYAFYLRVLWLEVVFTLPYLTLPIDYSFYLRVLWLEVVFTLPYLTYL